MQNSNVKNYLNRYGECESLVVEMSNADNVDTMLIPTGSVDGRSVNV